MIPDYMREEYNRYINSPQWKQKRAMALEDAQYRCQRCGYSKYSKVLEVHHVTYERLGHEMSSDLVVLCRECHEQADKERAIQGQIRSRAALENARFNGWAEKVFGDDWYLRESEEYVRDRYERWLDKHQYD